MQKSGSQVLDSICISEAEKQAVLTLIREEVHTFIILTKYVLSVFIWDGVFGVFLLVYAILLTVSFSFLDHR